MPSGSIVFLLSNAGKARLFAPVLAALESAGAKTVVLAGAEMHGKTIPAAALERLQVPVRHLLDRPIRGARDRIARGRSLRFRAEEILASEKASALVVHIDRTAPENLFIRAARNLGVPTVLLQESLRKDEMTRLPAVERWKRRLYASLFGLEFRLRHYGQEGCDRVLCWGPSSDRYFRRVGVPQERLVSVGNPAWDGVVCPGREEAKVRVSEKLAGNPLEPIILLATSPLDDMGILSSREYRRLVRGWLSALQRAAENRPGVRFVVKPHNLEPARFYGSMMQDLPRLQLVEDVDFFLLTIAASAILSFSTTSAMEGPLFGTPSGVLSAGKALDNWDFVENGVAEDLRDEAGLRTFLDHCLHPERSAALARSQSDRVEAGYTVNFRKAAAPAAAAILEASAR